MTADLTSLRYTPTANYHGTDSITVNVAETSFGKLTASSAMGVTVTGDHAPTVKAPTSLTTAEAAPLSLTGSNAITISDAENDVVSVTVSVAHGTLTAGSQTGSSITFTDTASNVTADLTSLSYTPTANYHGTDSITVNVAETSFGKLTASSAIGVTITGDQAPMVTVPSAVSTAEGTAISLTGSNAIVISDPENDVVSVTVSAAHGTLTAGSQTGSSITFTDTASNVTADLTSLSYTPTANYHGTDSISVNVAETAFGKLKASSSVGVTITGDQAPTLYRS